MSVETLQVPFENLNAQPHSGRYASDHIDECRRLVARRYLDMNYIKTDDIDTSGFIDTHLDPYVADSEYFWKKNEAGDIIATLRIIHPDVMNPDESLPIVKSFDLYDVQEQILTEAQVRDPSSVVEISALAKEKGVDTFAALDMYREVWQHAKRTDIEICAISADKRLYDMLRTAFGDAIIPAGEPTEMMGSLTVPCFLYPDRCAEAMAEIYAVTLEKDGEPAAAEYRGLIDYLREGLEPEFFATYELDALEAIGISYE